MLIIVSTPEKTSCITWTKSVKARNPENSKTRSRKEQCSIFGAFLRVVRQFTTVQNNSSYWWCFYYLMTRPSSQFLPIYLPVHDWVSCSLVWVLSSFFTFNSFALMCLLFFHCLATSHFQEAAEQTKSRPGWVYEVSGWPLQLWISLRAGYQDTQRWAAHSGKRHDLLQDSKVVYWWVIISKVVDCDPNVYACITGQ